MMKKNLLLLGLVVTLATIPFFIQKGALYGGTDNKAGQVISQLAPNYKPWYSSIWTPPSSEVESFLFALQAALGAGFIGYFIGYSRGKKVKERE